MGCDLCLLNLLCLCCLQESPVQRQGDALQLNLLRLLMNEIGLKLLGLNLKLIDHSAGTAAAVPHLGVGTEIL